MLNVLHEFVVVKLIVFFVFQEPVNQYPSSLDTASESSWNVKDSFETEHSVNSDEVISGLCYPYSSSIYVSLDTSVKKGLPQEKKVHFVLV